MNKKELDFILQAGEGLLLLQIRTGVESF